MKPTITTLEDACEFILENKVCTIFGSKNSPYPSLWDNTDLSDKKPDEGGWSPRVMAIWRWKTEIPQTFPDEFFYGKVPGGDAVLMEMEYFRSEHYPRHHKPVSGLDELPQQLYEYILTDPWYTGDLRRTAMIDLGCTKSRFDTALKKLQISLNIVRSNDPIHENDLWLPFHDQYPEIAGRV
ncbi:MAG: hypothetical protein HKN43_00230 [Rhodothermales bacterium]|nr:hypothetical protein [Rhodothermales bacterium]